MLQPALSADAPIVEVRDVRQVFAAPRRLWRAASEVRAVDGVSFSVARGRTFGIVGESGCGKSTLASLLIGDRVPQGGEIRIAGETVQTHLARGRKSYARVHPDGRARIRSAQWIRARKVGPADRSRRIAIHFVGGGAARAHGAHAALGRPGRKRLLERCLTRSAAGSASASPSREPGWWSPASGSATPSRPRPLTYPSRRRC